MLKNLVIKFLTRRASKFLTAAIGSGVTWVAAHGIPLDQWISDEWVSLTGGAVTAGLVYAIRNIGD